MEYFLQDDLSTWKYSALALTWPLFCVYSHFLLLMTDGVSWQRPDVKTGRQLWDPTETKYFELPSEDTHAVVDKVGDVALVSCVHRVHVLHVVQVEQVCGALPVVDVTPPLCFIRGDDLQETTEETSHRHHLFKDSITHFRYLLQVSVHTSHHITSALW